MSARLFLFLSVCFLNFFHLSDAMADVVEDVNRAGGKLVIERAPEIVNEEFPHGYFESVLWFPARYGKCDLSTQSLANILGDEELKKMNLSALFVRDCPITEIPKALFEFHKNLGLLHIEGAKITQVPNEILELKKLHILVLNNNQIRSIPDSICSVLRNLSKFTITNNGMILSQELIRQCEQAQRSSLGKFIYQEGNLPPFLPFKKGFLI